MPRKKSQLSGNKPLPANQQILLDVGKYIKICCAKNIYYLDNIYILRYNMTI